MLNKNLYDAALNYLNLIGYYNFTGIKDLDEANKKLREELDKFRMENWEHYDF